VKENRNLVLSFQAQESLDIISIYIENTSGFLAAEVYLSRVFEVFDLLESRPQTFSKVYFRQENRFLSKALVNKLTVILYTYTDTHVYVEYIFDTRSNWLG
jgi:hypothetical protein